MSVEYRNSLPSAMIDRSKYSIWSILKQCVDKELYRFTIPIVWNEPLSLLQRMAENMKYSNFLIKASQMTSSLERMKYVAAFLVSTTSIHNDRLSKPFNPLLGETYEFLCSQNKYRICCEQVSHHPPISAYYSESIEPSAKWKYYGSVNPHLKLNVLNASVEAFPEGIQTVELPEYGEVYTWHNLKINAHNLILGKLWFEYTGKTEIVNHKEKIKCVLEYKPYSWFYRTLNRCEGYICDFNDRKLALLYGKWSECLFYTTNLENPGEFAKKIEKILNSNHEDDYKNLKDVEILWKSDLNDIIYPEYYNFNRFTFKLNERILKETGPIAPTDCRLRPDMRLYESGQIEVAAHEKNRLEEKQRETQRKVELGERENAKPLWFDKKPHHVCNDEETWTFNHSYWNREFSVCPSIF